MIEIVKRNIAQNEKRFLMAYINSLSAEEKFQLVEKPDKRGRADYKDIDEALRSVELKVLSPKRARSRLAGHQEPLALLSQEPPSTKANALAAPSAIYY